VLRREIVGFGQWFLAPPLAALISMAACSLAPTAADWPFAGAALGTASYATFPLPQYGFWFVAGLHAAHGGRWPALWCWLLAGAATAGFCLIWRENGALPARFPPSAAWVFGAALPLMVTACVARLAAARVTLPQWTLMPGRHVLFFLMASNLALFANRYVNGKSVMDLPSAVGAAAALVCVIIVLRLAWDQASARLQAKPGK